MQLGLKVEAAPQNFKGLKPVSIESSGTVYRYFYGETNSYDEVKQLQKEAVEKGYKDAFIVAYKKGSRISVDEALKTDR